MKVLLVVSVLTFAGCASSPDVRESKPTHASTAARTSDIMPQASRRARAASANSRQQVTPELRAAWEAEIRKSPLGDFRLVMKDGKEYFCRREAPTGSKMKRGLCLTREELTEAEAATQRQMREFQRPATPNPARHPLEPPTY